MCRNTYYFLSPQIKKLKYNFMYYLQIMITYIKYNSFYDLESRHLSAKFIFQ
jgi:hypothetical protein